MYHLEIFKHKLIMLVLRAVRKLATIPKPDLFVGNDSSLTLCDVIASHNPKHVLLVTDEGLSKIGLYATCIARLEQHGVALSVFDEISPNPTADQIDQGITFAKQHNTDAILAFGGGSAIDSAKVIAAGVTNNLRMNSLNTNLVVRKIPLPFYAIPTTAGTGSEATIAAVITYPQQQRKKAIANFKLVPKAAALDANLMLKLPADITAATGMDVLTHAIETYISTLSTAQTRQRSEYAISTVFKQLTGVFKDGNDFNGRTAMAYASYQAGLNINDAGIGYVHAIAHKMGGKYGLPHGFANAVILPHVLRFSKSEINDELCDLAQLVGLPASADAFIEAIEKLNEELNIPKGFHQLKAQDIEEVFAAAQQEALSLYPVPKYMTKEQGEDLVRGLMIES